MTSLPLDPLLFLCNRQWEMGATITSCCSGGLSNGVVKMKSLVWVNSGPQWSDFDVLGTYHDIFRYALLI